MSKLHYGLTHRRRNREGGGAGPPQYFTLETLLNAAQVTTIAFDKKDVSSQQTGIDMDGMLSMRNT